jgi:hypothetical protein
VPGIEPRTSGSAARNSDHLITEVFILWTWIFENYKKKILGRKECMMNEQTNNQHMYPQHPPIILQSVTTKIMTGIFKSMMTSNLAYI